MSVKIRHAIPDVKLIGELAAPEDDSPKWQHVANENQYLGYRSGEDPFSFTRQTFSEMIKNFRSNPQFKADSNGVGCADVIQWDFEHASEAYGGDGSIPVEGAPAQGWVQDLKIEDGPDGKAQLWALSRFLPKAREYIKNGQYKWASVAVHLFATDGVSGERIGALLTSIALTNHPFIQNLEPLAASMKSGVSHKLRVGRWYEPAGTASDAIANIKDLLGMPELSTLQQVVSELNKLKQWVETGTTPLGIDVNGIFGCLRQILSLGAMTNESEVLDALEKIAQRAIEEQAISDGMPVPNNDNAAFNVAGANEKNNGGREMIKTLASKFGVKEVEKEILEAANEAVELRDDVSKALGVSKVKEIPDAIVFLKDAEKQHVAILKALGSEKAEDAVAAIGDLQSKAKELSEIKPKFEDMEKRVKDIDLKQAETDVDMVIAANGFDASLKDALLLQRQNDPKAFADKFPVDPKNIHLTQQKTTDGPAGGATDPSTPAPVGDVIKLSDYPGINNGKRAEAYLSSKDPSFKDLDFDAKTREVHNFLQRPNVIKE